MFFQSPIKQMFDVATLYPSVHYSYLHWTPLEIHLGHNGDQWRYGKNSDLGSAEVWEGIFSPNLKLWGGHKLHRIMLVHVELVTFNFHFPQIQKLFMFMIFGPGGHVHDPWNKLFLTFETPN